MFKKTLFIITLIPLFFAWSYSFAFVGSNSGPICFVHHNKKQTQEKSIGSISMTDRYISILWDINDHDRGNLKQGWIKNYEASTDRITADTYLEVFEHGVSAKVILTKSFFRIFPEYKEGGSKIEKPILARVIECPSDDIDIEKTTTAEQLKANSSLNKMTSTDPT